MSELELDGLEWNNNHGLHSHLLLLSHHIGQELAESTLVETGTAAGEDSSESVSASTVIDTRTLSKSLR